MSDDQQGTAEIHRDALAALLERHGLGELHTATLLSDDAERTVLAVNDQLIIKLQRHAAEAHTLRAEAALFRRLRHATDVPCPEVLVFDTQRDTVPFDALITRQAEGVVGATIWPKLDLSARERVSEELGRLCASFHSLGWAVYGSVFGLGRPPVRSARWADIVNSRITSLYHQAAQRALLPLPVLDELVSTLNDGDAVFDTPSPPVLVHGDLGLGNVLLRQHEDHWHVSAILGWEGALLADAAWEFATLWRDPTRVYPFADSFVHGYKERRPLQDDRRVRQRLYRLLSLLEQLVALAEPAAERAQFLQTTIVRLLKPL